MFNSSRATEKPEPDALLDVQHGGDHYKGMGIQPVEFAYANGYDDCAFSILKYVSRHRRKAGALDLDKAAHFVDLRVQMIEKHGECEATDGIRFSKYLRSNNIPPVDANVLYLLHRWTVGHFRKEGGDPNREIALALKGLINDLKVETYGEKNA